MCASSLPKTCVGALCVVMYKMCGVGTDVLGKQSAVVYVCRHVRPGFMCKRALLSKVQIRMT
jgi:hypothetical protein